LRLRLESLAAGGEAVARAPDGRVVFADGGVPGDLVEVVLSETKARFARGRVVEVIEASTARVTAPCPVADRCGGCPWQIVAEPAQRAAKQDIVERALRRLAVPVQPIIAAPTALGYRVRATLHANDGEIGFHARRSHALVSHAHCLALAPAR
jgi:23S rRNA (uracil1939-C5)-methyltransferase